MDTVYFYLPICPALPDRREKLHVVATSSSSFLPLLCVTLTCFFLLFYKDLPVALAPFILPCDFGSRLGREGLAQQSVTMLCSKETPGYSGPHLSLRRRPKPHTIRTSLYHMVFIYLFFLKKKKLLSRGVVCFFLIANKKNFKGKSSLVFVTSFLHPSPSKGGQALPNLRKQRRGAGRIMYMCYCCA